MVAERGLLQFLTGTSPSAPDGAATSPQRGGRVGGAGGVGGHAHARDSSLRAAPSAQNDKVLYMEANAFFVILRRILSPVILRSAATKDLALARFHITGAPLRGGSVPPKSQSKAGVPHSGVAVVWRDPAFTRAARPEGKRGDSQEGRNRRCLPSCAQCGRAGRVPARDARVLPSPCRANTQGWHAEVAEPEETARRVVAQASFPWPFGPIHLLAPYGRFPTQRAGSISKYKDNR